jgi:hypothetical protein
MKSYYSYLLNTFALSARNSQIDVNFASYEPFLYRFPSKPEANHLSASRPLHLRNCKTRAGDIVDVLVSFSEGFATKDEKITVESRVAVAYFKVDLTNNNATFVLGLHYDFDRCDASNEPKAGHPRFHVQVSPDVITSQQIKLIEDTFPYTCINATPSIRVSEIARIPTAHMCLASVLVSLAADFFVEGDFRNFLEKVREYQNIFPKPNTKEMLANISADKSSMRSCAWYHQDSRSPKPQGQPKGNSRHVKRRN